VRSFQVSVEKQTIAESVETDKQKKEVLEETPIVAAEVKGAVAPPEVQLGYCKYRYNVTNKQVSRMRCDLKPAEIPRIDHVVTKDGVYWLDTLIEVPKQFNLFIETTRCKPRSLWDPSTWFWCSEERIDTQSRTLDVRGSIWALVQGKKIDGYKTDVGGGKHRINFPLADDMSSKKLIIRYDTSYAEELDENVWLDIFEFSPKSNTATIPKVKPGESETHPYRFPFERMIGVTQWYGNTDYQHPHTGIDFGSRLEPVYAVADGKIVYAGWDNGSNKCLTGGNYILIEHKGGKHTIYLHLKDFINEKGKAWKAGDKIYKGQRIGTTGNTGLYNCEPLGYHLHFETRTSRSYKSHTNPVPLVNVDWNKILTLGYGTYPGRLSGENPHPGR
jgi:murein DD-endopeptidase MepM/ murein hydrolase activator NlpD